MADREPTGEALTGAEDVHGYVGRVCFKTGPPRRVGVELEWLVADADRLYLVGAALEAALHERWNGPLLAKAPALEGAAA